MPEISNGNGKKPIRVATCMPKQLYDPNDKLEWLRRAIKTAKCDLFLTPQEYIGGHYIGKRLASVGGQFHVDRDWLIEKVGRIAFETGTHIGIGACVKTKTSGAMEDYCYFDPSGTLLGWHSKFALPSYDDARTEGHGNLWPEISYNKRASPIDLPRIRLRVGTIFCWEVFTQMLWGSYSMQRCNLIAHPIKFAPRGWLKNKKLSDGKLHIVGFGNAPESEMWVDRLIAAGRHQVMCPIAVSCNSWDLGEKFMALVGHVDEMRRTTSLQNIPSLGHTEVVHTFTMLPEFYEGLDHHHSAGAFVGHTGSLDGYHEMGEWTMHAKMRRLEAHLIGGTTALDCKLKASSLSRQKASSAKRLFGRK